MPARLQIAVVGYGIAGVAAAVFLRRLGHEVVHFERSAAASASGAGLLLQGVGLAMLDRLGLLPAAMALGARVTRIQGETLDGRRVMDLRCDGLGGSRFALGIQRGVLLDLLRTADSHAAQLQTSQQITAVDAERGYLFASNQGRFGPFDLIVVADGANSNLRAGLKHLVLRDRLYRSGAVVCMLDDPDDVGDGRVFQSFSGARHVSLWPVGSSEAGAPRRISVSINVPLSQADQLRNVPVWRRHVARLCPRLTPMLEEVADRRSLLLYSYRDVVLRRYYAGRVVLIGDAAHSMSPQLGQGAGMAMLDAWVLAATLEHGGDLASALARFDRQQRPELRAYQRVSRWMTPAFQSDSLVLAVLRDRMFYPLSRVPLIKRSMQRMLAGTQPGSLAAPALAEEPANTVHS